MSQSSEPLTPSTRHGAADKGERQSPLKPFRKAIVRGLAVVMPPLLTLVLFLWAWNMIDSYVLRPVESVATEAIFASIRDIRSERQIQADPRHRDRMREFDGESVYQAPDGRQYVRINRSWIPRQVFETVQVSPGALPPTTARAYYDRYIRVVYLQRVYVIPAFLAIFILLLYALGKLLAAGIGRMIFVSFEAIITRLPVVRTVYSAVKQVTDFALNDTELQFTRIVAVEYPRKGIWSLGFVTGESMMDIRTAANQPIVSVLMPTSPMPATGFTINVPKSDTVDLNISLDQAIQFCVSCGVVVPPHQQWRATLQAEVRAKINDAVQQHEAKKSEASAAVALNTMNTSGDQATDSAR